MSAEVLAGLVCIFCIICFLFVVIYGYLQIKRELKKKETDKMSKDRIGWKQCLWLDEEKRTYKCVIVKLLIPADAKVVAPNDYVYRCDKAKVLEFQEVDGNEIKNIDTVYSWRILSGESFIEYNLGKTVYPDFFDENEEKIYTNGIHYYVDKTIPCLLNC